jgi:plasmid maintenance system killer protein
MRSNYRITFSWSGENALDVDFEDYHQGGIREAIYS